MGNNYPQNLPDEYRPISAWGYFGLQLLFTIPIVGFILLIVFSFGASRNRNLKSFARSYWCWLLICAIIAAITVIVILAIGASLSSMF